VVIVYRRFGKTYRSHHQGSRVLLYSYFIPYMFFHQSQPTAPSATHSSLTFLAPPLPHPGSTLLAVITLTDYQSPPSPSPLYTVVRHAGCFFLNFLPLKMGPIRCPETSVNNYHTTPGNIPEERRSHQHRRRSLKSNLFLPYCSQCISTDVKFMKQVEKYRTLA
jgi:hypothetical protein